MKFTFQERELVNMTPAQRAAAKRTALKELTRLEKLCKVQSEILTDIELIRQGVITKQGWR
jgi:hypothetical protein